MRTGIWPGVLFSPLFLQTAEISRESWKGHIHFLHQTLVCTRPWFKRDLRFQLPTGAQYKIAEIDRHLVAENRDQDRGPMHTRLEKQHRISPKRGGGGQGCAPQRENRGGKGETGKAIRFYIHLLQLQPDLQPTWSPRSHQDYLN